MQTDTFSLSKPFGEFEVEGSEQTCPDREILPNWGGWEIQGPPGFKGWFWQISNFQGRDFGLGFPPGLVVYWPVMVKMGQQHLCPSVMDGGWSTFPRCFPISGPGLEGDKTPLQCLQRWTCPLPWALSALSIYLLQCLLWTQPPQHLLLTVPQVPMNSCTFSLLMFKVSCFNTEQLRASVEETGLRTASNYAQRWTSLSKLLRPRLSLQPQPFPWVLCDSQPQEGCPRRGFPYSAQSVLAVLHVDHQCDPVQLLSRSSCSYMFVSFNFRDDIGLILSHPTLVLILCTVGWNQRVQTQVLYLFVGNNIKMTSQGPSSPVFWFAAVI